MKCPECERLGLKSTVQAPGGSYTTLMAHSPFWDEDGDYHSHDPNWISTGYRCSNGHQFATKSRASCPSCDYGKSEQTVTVLAPVTNRFADHEERVNGEAGYVVQAERSR